MQWAALDATLIFFEGPSRLAASLADMTEILGARDAAIARELTKRHEEIRRFPLDALARHYREAGPPRGEAVIVVGRAAGAAVPTGVERDGRQRARHGGVARRALYERALALTHGKPEQDGKPEQE